MSESEIKRLKEQIELETEAGKNALQGFRVVASHDVITHSMERMWEDIEKLERVAGREETRQFLSRL